jgi:general secretion pathway protein M
MSEPQVAAPPSVGPAVNSGAGGLAPMQRWWRARAARERLLLALGAAIVAAVLLWMVAAQPAWQTLRQAPAQIEKLDAQLQGMRALAEETKQLRAAPAVAPEQAAAALKGAAERLGAKAKLSMQGDRAVLTLNALEPSQLVSWLAEVRSGARARPLEANLTRVGGGLSGTLVLGMGAAP